MSSAQERIDNSNKLINDRYEWDAIWSACARLVLPMQDREFRRGSNLNSRSAIEGWAAGPTSVDRLSERFDITALIAVDRLATGLLSLVTPDNEKWMNLGMSTPLGPVEPNDEEKRWLEKQRDYLFGVRYSPEVGWQNTNGFAFRGVCTFGTSIFFLEESYGVHGKNDVQVPYTYQPMPLSENYLTADAQGNVDGDHRRFRMSARQAAQMFGTQLSGKVMAMANDPKRQHDQVEFLHVIEYRQEAGPAGYAMRNSKVSSCYIEVETKHYVRHGGFNYFPIMTYHWNKVPFSPYGESPVFLVLAEIKGSNVLAKNALLSAQQLTRPPVATAFDGDGPKPNLNPAAINYGMLDARGELKVKPIITAQNPSLVQEVLNASRDQIKEGLYTNLWQVLLRNPQMTATEALIRANEKGELLGPIGSKLQDGISRCTDAELTILEGKGAWRPGALLEPPASVAGRDVRPVYNSPLDRLRRSGELLGIQRTIEMIRPIAEIDESVLDTIDTEAIVELAQEINGAPRKMLRKPEEIAARREQRAQAMQAAQAQQAAAAVGGVADATMKAVPAANMATDFMKQAGIDAGDLANIGQQ